MLACAALTSWLGCAVITTAKAESRDGWWVVLGSVVLTDSSNFTPEVEAATRRVEAAALRCGVSALQDFSSKFRGFAPGYAVVVAGAYATRAAAERALARLRPCIGGAYLKQASYAGE
jgi:hypothetical protein